LFCQAIKAVSTQKIDSETLLNGVSYFTGPLLNWTLVGVIKALVREAQFARYVLILFHAATLLFHFRSTQFFKQYSFAPI
jgi:uncharacterized membrane protein